MADVRKFSDRSFGFLLSFVCLLTGVLQIPSSNYWVFACLIASGILAAGLAILQPKCYCSLADLWFSLGQNVGRLLNPLTLAVLFFCIFCPIAILAKIFNRDRFEFRKNTPDTFWQSNGERRKSIGQYDYQF